MARRDGRVLDKETGKYVQGTAGGHRSKKWTRGRKSSVQRCHYGSDHSVTLAIRTKGPGIRSLLPMAHLTPEKEAVNKRAEFERKAAVTRSNEAARVAKAERRARYAKKN